jgi:hypothetical protein
VEVASTADSEPDSAPASFIEDERDGADVSYAGLGTFEAEAFLRELQDAVAKSDKTSVARLVQFPIEVFLLKKKTIRTASEFVKNYDLVIYPELKDVLSKATPKTLFARGEGVMIGRGELWFGRVCTDPECLAHDIKVIAINPPIPPALRKEAGGRH